MILHFKTLASPLPPIWAAVTVAVHGTCASMVTEPALSSILACGGFMTDLGVCPTSSLVLTFRPCLPCFYNRHDGSLGRYVPLERIQYARRGSQVRQAPH